jgi:fucose permease
MLALGFSIAVSDAGLNAYVAELPQSTALLNYLHAFYGVGALLGPLVASTVLAISLGWNSVYVLWAMLGLLLCAGLQWGFRSQSPARTEGEDGAVEVQRNTLATVLHMRVVWLAALFLLFYVGTEVSLGSWTYTFLTEGRHGPALLSGWIVSGYWFGLTLGRLTLARLGQRIGGRLLIQGCLVGAVLGILLVWLLPFQATAALGLCLTGFSLGPIFPTVIALMPEFIASRLLATAIGLLASLGSMGGALFPWLAGNLIQDLGLWFLLPYAILLTSMMLICWLALQARTR